MNRKDFLFKTGMATFGLALAPNLLSCTSQRMLFPPMTLSGGDLKNVRGNISRYTNKGGTVGIFEIKDGFVIVDSQFPDSIQPVLDGISSKNKPVLYLANTHHHGDHTSGNISFKNLTKNVVAHTSVPELQRKAAEEKKNLDHQLYANILFENEYKFDLGNEKVTGVRLGAGHTFGDAVYYFEKDNVVHMGDLMFLNMIPVYRTKDGANSFGWIDALDNALNKFDNDTLFIFGHSDKPENSTGTKENLREMKNFLEASNEFVRGKMLAGTSDEQILKEHQFIPGFANRTTPHRFPDFVKGIRETIENN